MHTHSLWSDGDDYLEGIGLWYRDHGYDFLVFTDHNVLPTTERWVEYEKTKGGKKAYERLKERFPDWVEERETEGKKEVRLRTFPEVAAKLSIPNEFLLIQGEEISDRFEGRPLHMNASNVREVITPRGGTSMAEAIQNKRGRGSEPARTIETADSAAFESSEFSLRDHGGRPFDGARREVFRGL
jgi:hypothetical protein